MMLSKNCFAFTPANSLHYDAIDPETSIGPFYWGFCITTKFMGTTQT